MVDLDESAAIGSVPVVPAGASDEMVRRINQELAEFRQQLKKSQELFHAMVSFSFCWLYFLFSFRRKEYHYLCIFLEILIPNRIICIFVQIVDRTGDEIKFSLYLMCSYICIHLLHVHVQNSLFNFIF